MTRVFALLALMVLGACPAIGEIPRTLGGFRAWERAVLQHGMPIPLQCDVRLAEGTEVTVSIAGHKVSAKVKDRQVKMVIPAINKYGPHDMVVEIGDTKVQVKDVQVGEVWLCVGQSNMMFSMSKMTSPQSWEPAMGDKLPDVRFSSGKGWTKAVDDKVIKNLPGTPYYFGRELHRVLKVPIGLRIHGAGGSSLWKWTPEELHKRPELVPLKAVFEERNEMIKKVAESGKLGSFPKMNAFPPAKGFSPKRYPYFPVKEYGALDPIRWLPHYPSRGIIFWQGENDQGLGANYEQLFGAMIEYWRSKSDREWPLIFVQLPSYRPGPDKANSAPSASDGIEGLRDAQRRVADRMKNVQMMVALDIYGVKSEIHPSNKLGYGKRLAQTALGMVYKHDVPWQSPEFDGVEFSEGKATVTFRHTGEKGLRNRSGGKSVREFLLAGKDQVFHPATATIADAKTIVVTSDAVPQPVAVRYGWRKSPHVDLVGDGDLPVSPFRSDDWELFPVK